MDRFQGFDEGGSGFIRGRGNLGIVVGEESFKQGLKVWRDLIGGEGRVNSFGQRDGCV